jgi:2-C-methyl-D-erythritol 4-phosphate cytidylyltransferase
VCVAAGRGERFGGDKLAETLGARTVLETSLAALRRALPEAPLVVVVAEDRIINWRHRLSSSFPGARVVAGGPRRQDSVRAGVAMAEEIGAEIVVVHDAARPLIDPADVRRGVSALGNAAGSVLCAAVGDTVKRVDAVGVVAETIPREDLRLAQTPQVFRVAALEEAWGRVDGDRRWTDESALLESAGMTVQSVVARKPNPKLTDPSDLQVIRAMLDLV